MFESDSGAYSVIRYGTETGESHEIPERLSLTGSEEIVFFPKGYSTGGSLTLEGPGGRSYIIEVDHVTGLAKLTRL